MGYYTSHELDVETGEHELIAELVNNNEDIAYAIDEDGESQESCKWYRHEKDLRAFSKKHPEALFKLSGEGEESGDIWIEYYKDGKMQRCKGKITFDEYKESELK